MSNGAPGGILALDLSTRTGWAYGHRDKPPLRGVWLLGKMQNMGRCCSAFAGELEDAITTFRPARVIMEAPLPSPAQTSTNTARLQFGLAAVAEMIAYEAEVRIEEARAHEVRKLVLGRAHFGKDTKAMVERWCRDRGWPPAEDNDADAMLLLHYAHLLASAT